MTHSEKNLLIEEFMGSSPMVDFPSEDGSHLRYYDSWSWLMPVVEKIKFWYDNESDSYPSFEAWQSERNTLWDARIFYSLKEVYGLTIQFIQWYNTNKEVTK